MPRRSCPRLREFKPDLLMISAGFDAHEDDPLGQLRMTTPGFARLTAALLGVAGEVCEGRVVLVTEGGYDTHALAACLQAVIDVRCRSATRRGDDSRCCSSGSIPCSCCARRYP